MLVKDWIWMDSTKDLEGQAKYFIASEAEGYINGINDCNYEPMTRDGWIHYIEYGLNIAINDNIIVNGAEPRHLRFLGKKKIRELIEEYVDNYSSIQENLI